MDESIKEFARLDGVVTLIDAKHIEQVRQPQLATPQRMGSIGSYLLAASRRGEAGGSGE